jgi:hypothetical protein
VKKRLSPQEKKRLAYKKDHYVLGRDSCHSVRKTWPKKKARVNQEHRRRVAQALLKLETIGDLALIENTPAAKVRAVPAINYLRRLLSAPFLEEKSRVETPAKGSAF